MIIDTNEWNGKFCCFLGDSITDRIGTSYGNGYMDYLETLTGMKSQSYGVNGAQFIDLIHQAERMENEHKSEDIDAIFVFAGTNNYNASNQIGEWYQTHDTDIYVNFATGEKTTRTKREFNFDPSTFKGQINCVLSHLKENHPNSQIILMTPIHRAYATFGDTNIQYDELHSNALGLYIEDYANIVREAADIWCCPLIDLYRNCGLFPLYDSYSEYFANKDVDRLHPNSEGHKRIARTIAANLRSIPAGFDLV